MTTEQAIEVLADGGAPYMDYQMARGIVLRRLEEIERNRAHQTAEIHILEQRLMKVKS